MDTVSDAFGPKAYDPTKLVNWAPTRYVPWSSWAVATNIWPNASGNNSTEAESSGMAVYAHELSHNLAIPDNYNNPFDDDPAADGLRHVGHDEPRLVQRPGRSAHPLPDPADPGRRARRAAQPAQQALPELHRRRATSCASTATASRSPASPWPRSRRVRWPPTATSPACACCSTAATRTRPAATSTEPDVRGPVVHDGHRHDRHGRASTTTRWRSSSRSARTPSRRATAS